MTTNIRRRGGVWYLRVSVPRDLYLVLGKKEIWQSLRTSDHSEARRLAPPRLDALHRDWEAARSRRSLTPADIEHAIWDRYSELIDGDERFRAELPTEDDLDEIWKHLVDEFDEHSIDAFRILEIVRGRFEEERAVRGQRLLMIRQHAARGETRSVADVMSAFLARKGLEVTNSGDRKKLAQGFQRAEMEAHARFLERDAGDFAGEPRDKLVRPPKLAKEVLTPVGETIMGLFDRYERERPASARPDTWNQNRKIVALFADFAGPKAPVSVINRKAIVQWKSKLFEWPVKAAETKAFRGLGFQAVIDANRTVKKPAISGTTINKYLSAVGSFCRYLKSNGYIEDDATGLHLELDRSKRKVVPFNSTQLEVMFSSPLFNGCGGDKSEHEAGAIRVRDWRYWLPLIALYSGARLGEIAQLLVRDVKKIGGHWSLHICADGGEFKSVKTAGSERVVPIHPKLIKLGILDYRDVAGRGDHGGLFPEMKPDARGFMSGVPSKFFQGYFRAIGIKDDHSVNFHSFRHGIADAFRRAGFLDEEFGMLLGHVKATTTQRYGIVSQGAMASRVAMIEAVNFPEVPALVAV